MDRAGLFRRALEDGDIAALRQAWAALDPHLPQPKTDAEAEIAMHHGRTQAESVTFAKRAYSHAWLRERGYPSGLPDGLKPSAERLYPRVVEGVGVSVNFRSAMLKPAGPLIERAICEAIEDVYADTAHPDPALVMGRMAAARAQETKRLFGSLEPR